MHLPAVWSKDGCSAVGHSNTGSNRANRSASWATSRALPAWSYILATPERRALLTQMGSQAAWLSPTWEWIIGVLLMGVCPNSDTHPQVFKWSCNAMVKLAQPRVALSHSRHIRVTLSRISSLHALKRQ